MRRLTLPRTSSTDFRKTAFPRAAYLFDSAGINPQASIQLNERLSLRRRAKAIALSASDIAAPHPDPAWRSYRAIKLRSATLVFEEQPMIADNDNQTVMDWDPQPAWAEAWHRWTVIFPRRSITGRIVYGKIWRRYDGRHWKYKKFIQIRIDGDH
jgi:hypothetical protein